MLGNILRVITNVGTILQVVPDGSGGVEYYDMSGAKYDISDCDSLQVYCDNSVIYYHVEHGSDELYARPDYKVVVWSGDIEPFYAKTGDIWINGGVVTEIDHEDLVWTFDTTKAGSATDRIVLPMQNGQTYDFDVIYNGNVIKHINDYTDNEIIFSDGAGIKQITLRGTYGKIAFNNAGDKLKLKSIERWGNFKFVDNCLKGCANLTLNNVKGKPILFNNFYENLRGCTVLTQVRNINEWDVSGVTSMVSLFIDCPVFNQDLDRWDLSNVTHFLSMFNRCYAFNGNVTTWDVSNITEMNNGFNSCTSFNQDVSNWDVSNIKYFNNFFASCTSFNQDVSQWDMSNAEWLTSMFTNMNLNPDVSNWNITNKVTTLNNMFKNNTGFNRDITTWDTSGVSIFSGCFANATGFTGMVEMDAGFATSLGEFVLNTKIHTLILKNIRSGVAVVNAFNVQLGYLNKVILEDIDVSFDIKSFDLATVEALIELCNGDGTYRGIKDLTGVATKTVTLPNTANAHDATVTAAFTSKNWTIAYA